MFLFLENFSRLSMEGFCHLLDSIERRLSAKDVNLYRSTVNEQKLDDIIRSEKEDVLFPVWVCFLSWCFSVHRFSGSCITLPLRALTINWVPLLRHQQHSSNKSWFLRGFESQWIVIVAILQWRLYMLVYCFLFLFV